MTQDIEEEIDGIYYEDIYKQETTYSSKINTNKQNNNNCSDSCGNCMAPIVFLCYLLFDCCKCRK
jgi:hypothetical protein